MSWPLSPVPFQAIMILDGNSTRAIPALPGHQAMPVETTVDLTEHERELELSWYAWYAALAIAPGTEIDLMALWRQFGNERIARGDWMPGRFTEIRDLVIDEWQACYDAEIARLLAAYLEPFARYLPPGFTL